MLKKKKERRRRNLNGNWCLPNKHHVQQKQEFGCSFIRLPHLVPPDRSVVSCSTMLSRLLQAFSAVRERIKVCVCERESVCVGGDSMSSAGLCSNRQRGRNECRHRTTEWWITSLSASPLSSYPSHPATVCTHDECERLPLGTHYKCMTVSNLIIFCLCVCVFYLL